MCKTPISTKTKERGWRTFIPAPVCTLKYAPVCETDGNTYGNKCMLDGQGVILDYLGDCVIEIPKINPSVT